MKAQTCTSLGVCLDGPFGAPAQQFYNYDHSIVIGSGIGITPFSAILNHMQTSYNDDLDPWQESKRSSRARKSASSLVRVSMVPSRDASPSSIAYRGRSDSTSTIDKEEEEEEEDSTTTNTQQLELDAALPSTNRHFFSSRRRFIPSHSRSRPGGISGSEHLLPPLPSHHRRHRSLSPSASSCDENDAENSPENSEKSSPSPRTVHFHWLVRSQNNLQWFSNLLNRAIALRIPGLDLQVHTYITSSPSSSSSASASSSKMSTHVFRYLLDSYRAPESPYSALTGLIQPSRFGRPDMEGILEAHFRELCERSERSEHRVQTDERSRSRSHNRSRSRSHNRSHSQNDENHEFPKKDKKKKLLVGVFFCGAPALGLVLRDKCRELTTRGYSGIGGVGGSGVKVKYEFRMEVFG